MHTHGLLAGRFLPFHNGHLDLIRQASHRCRALTIWVCTAAADTIPGWMRYSWLKNTFTDLPVRHLVEQPGKTWAEQIRERLPADADLYFSLEEIPGEAGIGLPTTRLPLPFAVAPEDLLRAPQQFWPQVPEQVRPWLVRRVALVGPESCGKSVLTEKLAAHFQTLFVEEYGRTYCEKFGMNLSPLDFAHIAGGQLYREDEMARQAGPVLFCDTELLVTQVWSEIFFKGECQPWILWANHLRRYDLFLLLAPDIPWVNDGLREFEQQRWHMFERLQTELSDRGLRYTVIRGADFEQRTTAAIDAVQQVLGPLV